MNFYHTDLRIGFCKFQEQYCTKLGIICKADLKEKKNIFFKNKYKKESIQHAEL